MSENHKEKLLQSSLFPIGWFIRARALFTELKSPPLCRFELTMRVLWTSEELNSWKKQAKNLSLNSMSPFDGLEQMT